MRATTTTTALCGLAFAAATALTVSARQTRPVDDAAMTWRRAAVVAAVALLAVLSARAPITAAQRASVTIDVRAVALDVLVTRDGRRSPD